MSTKTQEALRTERALKLALEALEYWQVRDKHSRVTRLAITAIREALAEQCVCGEPDTPGTHRTDGPCLAEQPVQPSKPWQGLTDDEVENIVIEHDGAVWDVIPAIEAKLKEKNNG